jgi:hypothetical protein
MTELGVQHTVQFTLLSWPCTELYKYVSMVPTSCRQLSLCHLNIHSQGITTRWGKPHHKDNETHNEKKDGIKDILHHWMSGGHPKGTTGKVLIRLEVLEIL